MLVNRLVALKTQPNVIVVIAKQAQGRKRQFDVHSVIGPFTSLAWKFLENMPTNFLVTTATPTTPSSTYHIPEKTTVSTPLTDPASFGTYIQSLRSANHPIHRTPRQHALILPQDLANFLTKPFLQTHHLIGIVWYVSPFQSSYQAPNRKGSPWPLPSSQELTHTVPWISWPACPWSSLDKQPHHQLQPTMTQPKTWKDW